MRAEKKTVQLDQAEAEKKLHWRTSEREIWVALIGIVAFALAIDIITVAVIAYWQ